MKLKRKTILFNACVVSAFGLLAAYYLLFVFYPIMFVCRQKNIGMWEVLQESSIYPPHMPRYIILILGILFLAFFALIAIWNDARTRRIFSPLTDAMHFCEFLAAGNFPPPIRISKYADSDIAALIACLNTARDRMSSNMTRLKASHEREIEARRFAENAGELKSLLIARMAPDIRGPLNAVNGYVELIRRKYSSAEHFDTLEKLLIGIERNVDSMSETIVRMLAVGQVGRIGNENAGDVLTTTDFMNEVMHELLPRLESRNVEIEHVFSGSAPEHIYVDKDGLFQLLSLMVMALFRASNPGERISILCRTEANNVLFQVRDNRMASARERLADLYNVGRKDSRREEHVDRQSTTVLGLFFVESQAINMGGNLSAQSTKQALTELTLSVKSNDLSTVGSTEEKRNAPRQAENSIGNQERTSPSRRARRKYYVLVGEEDPDNAEVLEGLLTLDEFKVVRADSVAELIEKAQAVRFDAVLLSNAMRHRNMLSTIHKIRKTSENTDVPIFVMASKISGEKRKQLQMVGVSQIMLKPLNFKDLSRILQQVCLRYAGGRANE